MRPLQAALLALAFGLLCAPVGAQTGAADQPRHSLGSQCCSCCSRPTLACDHAVPSWFGKSAASGSLGSFASANPFKFLHAIAQMNDLEQRMYLEVIGEGLKVRRTPSHGRVTCVQDSGHILG